MATLTIFGATGATGRLVVAQALQRGASVIAAARRNGEAADALSGAEVRIADVTDRDAVARAISGADAVISCLGAVSRDAPPIETIGTRHMLEAMRHQGVRRLVTVGSLPLEGGPGAISLPARMAFALLRSAARAAAEDKRTQYETLRGSDVDWLLVRPVLLSNQPGTGRYQATDAPKVRLRDKIPRADLAAYLVDEALAPTLRRQVIALVPGVA